MLFIDRRLHLRTPHNYTRDRSHVFLVRPEKQRGAGSPTHLRSITSVFVRRIFPPQMRRKSSVGQTLLDLPNTPAIDHRCFCGLADRQVVSHSGFCVTPGWEGPCKNTCDRSQVHGASRSTLQFGYKNACDRSQVRGASRSTLLFGPRQKHA